MHILLHIGTPKTGTTSVQQTLANARDRLLEAGVLYPEVDVYSDHNLLSTPFINAVPRMYQPKYGNDLNALNAAAMSAWDTVEFQARETNPKAVVLSGEFFFRVPKVHALLNKIERTFPQASSNATVCYIRKPADYFVSAIQQVLKGSHVLIAARQAMPKYAVHLQRWTDQCPIVLRDFSTNQLQGEDLLADMFCHGGLADISLANIPRIFANETISAESMFILQRFRERELSDQSNVFVPAANRLLSLLMQCEADLGGREMFSKPKLKDAYSDHFRSATPDAIFLRDKMDFEFSDTDFSSYVPWPETPVKTVADIVHVDKSKVEILQARLLNHLLRAQV